jgi:hypothetical protein
MCFAKKKLPKEKGDPGPFADAAHRCPALLNCRRGLRNSLRLAFAQTVLALIRRQSPLLGSLHGARKNTHRCARLSVDLSRSGFSRECFGAKICSRLKPLLRPFGKYPWGAKTIAPEAMELEQALFAYSAAIKIPGLPQMKYGALNILPNALANFLSNMNFVHNILRQKILRKKSETFQTHR